MLFCWNECALSSIIEYVLSWCLVWKQGKVVCLSRVFLGGVFWNVREDISQEREGEALLSPYIFRLLLGHKKVFSMYLSLND